MPDDADVSVYIAKCSFYLNTFLCASSRVLTNIFEKLLRKICDGKRIKDKLICCVTGGQNSGDYRLRRYGTVSFACSERGRTKVDGTHVRPTGNSSFSGQCTSVHGKFLSIFSLLICYNINLFALEQNSASSFGGT